MEIYNITCDTIDDITYQVTREDHDESYYIISINDTATDEADQDNHEGTHFVNFDDDSSPPENRYIGGGYL